MASLATGFLMAAAIVGAASAAGKPNIVFMLMDNLGYGEPGVYGGGILRGAPTPRIDALAGQGTRLLNFNVEAQCTPTRSAFMTAVSRSARHLRRRRLRHARRPDAWEATIAQLLSAQGYATGVWGKWHLGSIESRFPTNRGSTSGTASRGPTTKACGRRRTRPTVCGRRLAGNRDGTSDLPARIHL